MQTVNDQISVKQLAKHINGATQCKNGYEIPHIEAIEELCKALPHGSGIDGKFEIQLELCKVDKIVFLLEFHHMDENGYYDGWTYHNVILTPAFDGYYMRITGQNKNDIKEYLSDLLYYTFQ